MNIDKLTIFWKGIKMEDNGTFMLEEILTLTSISGKEARETHICDLTPNSPYGEMLEAGFNAVN